MIRKLSSAYILVHSGFVIRCPMTESQFILGLLLCTYEVAVLLLYCCSLTILLFFLMLLGTCCFILSASLCLVRPTYRASFRGEIIDYTTFMSGRNGYFSRWWYEPSIVNHTMLHSIETRGNGIQSNFR